MVERPAARLLAALLGVFPGWPRKLPEGAYAALLLPMAASAVTETTDVSRLVGQPIQR